MNYSPTAAKIAAVARPGVLRWPWSDSVQPLYDYIRITVS